MYRLFTVAAVFIVLAGCEQGGGAGGDKLTPKEKARWEKFRKENPDTFLLVGYLSDFQAWKICVYDFTYYTHRWGEKFDYWSGAEKDKANKYANDLAQEKGVVTVAFVDLVSKDSPQVVWWYSLEGSQVKRSNKAPKKDLEESMKAYLRTLQSNADMMKP